MSSQQSMVEADHENSFSWVLKWHPSTSFPCDGSVELHGGIGGRVSHRLHDSVWDSLSGEGVPWNRLEEPWHAAVGLKRPQRSRVKRLLDQGYLVVVLALEGGASVVWQDAICYERKDLKAFTKLCLRRGTYLRWEEQGCIVESPGIRCSIRTSDAIAVAELCQLLHSGGSGLAENPVRNAIAELLYSAGVLYAEQESGFPDSSNAKLEDLAEWHERVFHHKWRLGEHAIPLGAVYPGLRNGKPVPPLFPDEEGSDGIALARRISDGSDLPSFETVLAARRSVRASAGALSAESLGHFLDLSHHPQFTHRQEVGGSELVTQWRPTAAGGSLHELDLFLNLHKVEGIPAGFYYYAPSRHLLIPIGMPTRARDAMRHEAESASRYCGEASVQILVLSRLQRLLWKYQSMAYAITLQNAGALQQTFYLVATSLGLAPCSIGNGNQQWLQSCPALDSDARWWVGNFLLSASQSLMPAPTNSRSVESVG